MNYSPFKIIEAALERLKSSPLRERMYSDIKESIDRLESITSATTYSEPGYSDPKSLILFGDWNTTIPPRLEKHWDSPVHRFSRDHNIMTRVCKLLEKLGCELEWEDEWAICSVCEGAVRTSPDSYGWRKSYYGDAEDLICKECTLKDPANYLCWLQNNPKRADTFDLPLKDLGYVQVADRLEHGFHHGQDADPQVITKHLRKCGVTKFLFSLDSVGQFDMDFSVWVHQDEEEKIPKIRLDLSDNTDGPSVSEGMKRALQNSTIAASKLPSGPGVVYTTCRPDGSAAAIKIPNEEFVKDGVMKADRKIAAGDPSVIIEK